MVILIILCASFALAQILGKAFFSGGIKSWLIFLLNGVNVNDTVGSLLLLS